MYQTQQQKTNKKITPDYHKTEPKTPQLPKKKKRNHFSNSFERIKNKNHNFDKKTIIAGRKKISPYKWDP